MNNSQIKRTCGAMHRRGSGMLVTLVLMLFLISISAGLVEQGVANHTLSQHRDNGRLLLFTCESAAHQSLFYIQENDDWLDDVPSSGTKTLTEIPGQINNRDVTVTVERLTTGYLLVAMATEGSDDPGHFQGRRTEVVFDVFEITNPSMVFDWAMFAKDSLWMKGNTGTDSFNSNLGSYASQPASSEGDVGANVGLTFVGGSNDIMGTAYIGPAGAVTGSANVSGGMAANTEDYVMPSVSYTAPSGNDNASLGLSTISPDVSFSGSGSETWSAGTYHLNNLSLGGSKDLNIDGAVTIYVDNDISFKGSGTINLNAGASLTVVCAGDVAMGGTSFVNSGPPVNMQLYLGGGTDQTISLKGNAEYAGIIYAPDVDIDFGGNFDLYGSMIANNINAHGTVDAHYDLALKDYAPTILDEIEPLVQVTAWRDAPQGYIGD